MRQLSNTLLRAQRPDDTLSLLSEAGETEKQQSWYWSSVFRAYWIAGKFEEAQQAIERAIELDPDSTDLRLKWANLLLHRSEFAAAETAIRDLLARSPDSLPALKLACRIHVRLAHWEDALTAAQSAARMAPDDLECRSNLGSVLLSLGRPADALQALADFKAPSGTDSRQLAQLDLLIARAQAAVGDANAAISSLQKVLQLAPDHDQATNVLAKLLIEQGRSADARPLLAKVRRKQLSSMPATLAEGLGQLAQRIRQLPAESPASLWAFGLADQSRWNWEDWRAAVAWSDAAWQLLLQWWKWQPEKRGEILDLIEKTDLQPLLSASAAGRGCVLAGAHVGISPAGVCLLGSLGIPFKVMGTADASSADEESDIVIPLRENMNSTVRDIVEHLEGGGAIGVACDDAIGQTIEMPFLGQQVRLPQFIPKLVRRHAAASFWWQPLWRSEKIIVELEPLPQPSDSESDDAWAERWYEAYLARLAQVYRGDPRNVRLASGIARSIDPPKIAAGFGISARLIQ